MELCQVSLILSHPQGHVALWTVPKAFLPPTMILNKLLLEAGVDSFAKMSNNDLMLLGHLPAV